MEQTVKHLLWAHRKLSKYAIKDRAISFILDTDFDHYIALEKSVEFIRRTFERLKSTDWFSLTSLGDQRFSTKLE